MAPRDPAAILDAFESNRGRILDELANLARTLSARMRLPAYLTPEDIAQEVLAICLQKLRDGSFRGECDIRTFVYRVTVNTCLSHRREMKMIERLQAELTIPTTAGDAPDARLLSLEAIRVIWDIVRQLPENCRELWRMVLIEGKDYRQAAGVLNVEEVTLRARMSECRKQAKKLRDRLERDQQ